MATPSPPLFHKVSPTGPREIMNHSKVLQVSEENKQVLSAVEALLSLSPVIHHQDAAAQKRLRPVGDAEPTTTTTTSSLATCSHHELRITNPESMARAAGTVSPCEEEDDESSASHSSAAASSTTTTTYFEGSCDLWCPEDEECLSPLHCFMRKYCVEAFTAKEFDISTPKFGRSLGRSISVGQVGVQCKWCKHRNYVDRPERAVCFPSTIKNIYHSIETWQRRHSTVCTDIPKWAKTQMTSLMKCSRSGAGGRRLYWEESAVRLGMVDTDTGVRFFRPPGTIDPPPMKQQHILQVHSVSTSKSSSSTALAADHTAEITTSVLVTTVSHPIVRPHDLELQITGYLYTLLEQMESCYFSDEDRIGGRSKVKSCQLGYPGIQCKHCGGKSGFGRYFPASCAALSSANSDRNIFNHISKCRKCPEQVRDSLTTLFKQQNTLKNRRGTRKIFFQRIWARMHQLKEDDLEVATQSSAASSPSRTTPPPRVVRENDRASSPVWQEPKPPQPPRPEVAKFVQEQPIVMMMYQADETLPSRVFHEPPPIIMRRQDELTPNNNMFQEPPCIMMLRQDESTTSNKMFQETPPIIMRRQDESLPIQMHRELPNTMMPLMRCDQLPMMQHVLVHEQEIHHQQQQHLRNMQQQHQARQQHYHEARQHQQQHQFFQHPQSTMQQQQQEMQQRLMVQRPTAQRPYVQFSNLADPQASTTLHQYSIPPYLYRQLQPSDSTSNVTSV